MRRAGHRTVTSHAMGRAASQRAMSSSERSAQRGMRHSRAARSQLRVCKSRTISVMRLNGASEHTRTGVVVLLAVALRLVSDFNE